MAGIGLRDFQSSGYRVRTQWMDEHEHEPRWRVCCCRAGGCFRRVVIVAAAFVVVVLPSEALRRSHTQRKSAGEKQTHDVTPV
jgi:hypothetical protein